MKNTNNNLSFADPWTEADTIRSAEAFALHGFTSNSGLPDIAFGCQFADQGTKKILLDSENAKTWKLGTLSAREGHEVSYNSFVYTHYPPGPSWIAGISAKIFEPTAIAKLRIIPVLIGLLSIACFLWQIFNLVGAIKGALAAIIFASIPMLSNMMHVLSYQGYALALLLFGIAICIKVFIHKNPSFYELLLLFSISHIQGWMGFDYFFLVISLPIIIMLLFPPNTTNRNKVYLMVMVCLIGFSLAHLVHFYQVINYLGSLDKALLDFSGTAAYRSQSITYDDGSALPSTASLLWSYLTTYSGSWRHLGWSALYYSVIGSIIILALPSSAQKYRLILGIYLSLFIASLWVITMPQHAAQHWHFIPRHYFICIFFTSIAVLSAIPQTNKQRILPRS